MSHHTIPRPRVASRPNEPVPTISLLPLRQPPEPLRHPSLPCPSRDHRFSSEYTVTTHLIPAAFPRASPFIPVPASPDNESKEERVARVQLYASELISLQAQHGPDHSGTQPRVLWNVVNRYVRKGNGGGLTLLLLHANGLHKEVNIYLYLICGAGGFAVPHTNYSRHLNLLSDIYYKPLMKTCDIASMRCGPLTPYNTVTLDLSTGRTSELYVGHSQLPP